MRGIPKKKERAAAYWHARCYLNTNHGGRQKCELTTWSPMELSAVIQYEWTCKNNVSIIHGRLHTMQEMRLCIVRWSITGGACSMKEDRMWRMQQNVEDAYLNGFSNGSTNENNIARV
ncbi:hypothetical protein TNCV_1762851 [Trichonephila clavipes]|nr:hypothetical protein TNCV_1762851 [Trichonephila clavipes]